MDKSILVTGAAAPLGTGVLKALDRIAPACVLGMDIEKPTAHFKRAAFVQADVRHPGLADILRSENVDTVCLLHFQAGARRSEADFDRNVMGTTKAIGAALEAGVRKIVVMSSTLVYGAQANNPAFLTEKQPLRARSDYGYVYDAREMDEAVTSFVGQARGTIVTVLRFPWIVGPLETPLTRYLRLPAVPVLLGFDPLLQIIHADDVIGALVHAVLGDYEGVFNIAAEPVLPLLKLVAQARKVPLPVLHPLAYSGMNVLEGLIPQVREAWPIPPDYLRYSVVADTGRMNTVLGFQPRYSIEAALGKFLEMARLGRVVSEEEQRLRAAIRQQAAIAEGGGDGP